MEASDNRLDRYPPGIAERGTVGALFLEPAQAEAAVVDLDANGFNLDNIGVAMASRDDQKQLIEATGSQSIRDLGQGTSGLLGTVVNLFKPQEALAEQQLAQTISEMGIPETEASHFARGVASGAVLVTVRVLGVNTTDALAILARHGADLGFTGS